MAKKIVLTEKEIQELEGFIIDLPYKIASPLLQYLTSKIIEEDDITEPEQLQ
jgi:hypothetical protein